jgi:hypothetical protein
MAGIQLPITVRITPDLFEQVRKGAARDNRSVTKFIETALLLKLDDGVDHSAVRPKNPKTHGIRRQ